MGNKNYNRGEVLQQVKLFRYYLKLSALGKENTLTLALADIAEAVCTSPRHARTLLKQMAELEWLSWQPCVGRNKRSLLSLFYSEDELRQYLAKQQISLGDYSAALDLLNQDQNWFGRLLIATSGASQRDGSLNIQLTYSRPFSVLLPQLLLRNSERFLLRQVYANLVNCNAQGDISPDLAHHWHCDAEAKIYCFNLRPQLQFHDGSRIDADKIVNLFKALKLHPQYRQELSHLASITALNPLTLEFQLSQSDRGFAGLLADPKYAIQPESQLQKNALSDKQVVGSGPFALLSHNTERIHLRANPYYHGFRALPDEVSIWFVATSNSAKAGLYAISDRSSEQQQHVQQRLEFGCQYLLFNQQRSALSYGQRRWLASCLQPEKLLNYAQKSWKNLALEPAYSLLDIWPDCYSLAEEEVPLPAALSIAYYSHDDLRLYAQTITHLLQDLGIKTKLSEYSFAELNQVAMQGKLEQNLIITSYNLDDNRPASAFRWFSHDAIIKHCVGQANWQWMQAQLAPIRETSALADYFVKMAPIANTLVNEYWCLPLFHHWQSLRFQNVFQDVAMTDWGWPQLKDVWLAPA